MRPILTSVLMVSCLRRNGQRFSFTNQLRSSFVYSKYPMVSKKDYDILLILPSNRLTFKEHHKDPKVDTSMKMFYISGVGNLGVPHN